MEGGYTERGRIGGEEEGESGACGRCRTSSFDEQLVFLLNTTETYVPVEKKWKGKKGG
jgi:hypothetical protein